MTSAITAEAKRAWALAFLCAGLGCGLMGPLLPVLTRQWGLADNRSGLLLGLLLAGSCCGTLTLQRRLERAVRRGVLCAAAGMTGFALCTRSSSGEIYAVALLAVLVTGFGLGSLMSAVNLLAGRLPAPQRTRLLARLGAVWCVGAMLSPVFVAPHLLGLSLASRLLLLAALFLGCLLDPEAWRGEATDSATSPVALNAPSARFVTLACAAAMFLYGGAEGCISGWLPTFAYRYGGRTLAEAPWVTSALWLGLILSRVAVPRKLRRAVRERFLTAALIGTALFLAQLIAVPQVSGISAGFIAGLLIGPGFPLVLSGTLDWRLGTRRMGIVLAAAAMGGAVCPLMVGQLSMVVGLRGAMLLPVAILLAIPWLPRRTGPVLLRGVCCEAVSV
jgi:fucose permease